jgi:DNA-binding response OmpR family regulator
MAIEKSCILIVDDDAYILEIMTEMLSSEGYEIVTATNGKSALETFKQHKVDLVLLDIMLPDTNGYSVCKQIKNISNVPIIMVTGKTDAVEEVEGFCVGADDYIIKPFRESILIARVKAMLRRDFPTGTSLVYKSGDIEIDFIRQTLKIAGKGLELTSTEFKIFSYLLLNRGRVSTHIELTREITNNINKDTSHLVQVNISRLRKKLDSIAPEQNYIETVPDIGYIFNITH